MPDLICDTSVLIVLHQVSQLSILSALGSSVIVSTAVVKELAAGRLAGSDAVDVALYPWMMVRAPTACPKLPSQATFGPGESGVIWPIMNSISPHLSARSFRKLPEKHHE